MTSEGQDIWYKTDVAYDLKKTGSAAVPPEDLLQVTRKWKAGGQPKPFTSGGPPANKRKRTTPEQWSDTFDACGNSQSILHPHYALVQRS